MMDNAHKTMRYKAWVPKWHGLVEERVIKVCAECQKPARMRTMQFTQRKYPTYLRPEGRPFDPHYWHDDAVRYSTRPLCKSCLDGELAMRDLSRLVGA